MRNRIHANTNDREMGVNHRRVLVARMDAVRHHALACLRLYSGFAAPQGSAEREDITSRVWLTPGAGQRFGGIAAKTFGQRRLWLPGRLTRSPASNSLS
jgi:hypothetical protein